MKKKSEQKKFRFYSLIFVLLNLFLFIVGFWWKWETVATIIVVLLALFYPLFMLKRFWNKIGDNWLFSYWIKVLIIGIIAGYFVLTELFP